MSRSRCRRCVRAAGPAATADRGAGQKQPHDGPRRLAKGRRRPPPPRRSSATASYGRRDRQSASTAQAGSRRSSGDASATSKPEPVGGIERRLPGKTAHLLAEDARLQGAVIAVIGHNELLAWRRYRRFLGNRQMVRQLRFAAQTAVGGILTFVDFGEQS